MIKIAGALLVLLAFSGLGNAYASDVRRRLKALYQCRNLAILLQGQIRYAGLDLAESLTEASGHLDGPFRDFCRNLAEKIKTMPGQDIATLWRYHTERDLKESGMKKEDRELFAEIGVMLGYLDGESQYRHLENYRERLDRAIGQAETETASKCRLYRSLGVLGGMFLTILLL
jgi:stage III sporulation protein AB